MAVPQWALTIMQNLPESSQERLQESMMKAMKDKYYIALTSLPIAFVLAYLPHFVALPLKIQKRKLDYNNDTPRCEKFEESKLIQRLAGAHYNSLEMFPIFASGVLLGRVQKVDHKRLGLLTNQYLRYRVLYVLFYTFGSNNKVINAFRTLMWSILFKICMDIYALSF